MRPPELFTTKRLLVRKPVPSDAAAAYRNWTQDAEVTHYLVWRPHTHVDITQVFVDACITNWTGGRNFVYVLQETSSGEVIGMADVRLDGFKALLGYVLARPWWNQGLMSEALQPIVDWLLDHPNIHRVWATHDVDNPASGRVMHKLGMAYEGTLKAWSLHPNVSHLPRDSVVYARVKP